MSDSATHDSLEGIAIIGMSGRFPGADTIDDFWRNLCDGVESIAFFHHEDLESSALIPADPNHPNFVKAGPVLGDIESFDASFFGYTPRDAEIMDPQQRLFLECAWEALENAGYDSERYKGWIGVYGGVGLPNYLMNNLYQNNEIRALMASGLSLQISTANNVDYLATRVSYKLNLKGPSINLQTACSTSLVATHLACQSLLNYQCDMALAGGASIRVPQRDGYWYQEGGLVSPDGHCRTFDARAQGTVFGSGVGVVALKRLADAIADGNHIYAVIKGSAVNNDGSSKVGFTAPGVDGQTAVIALAQDLAGVDPETISYIEAHGTATPVGDPIEIAALTQAFRASTQKKGFCAIGSVKTNIGHTNTAAGVIGLIKTVLALKHRQIPPSLHFERPNPKIDFANSPFYVNTTLAEWNTGPTPRRAGVNSFGVGGTNAHLVLEEAPPLDPSGPSRPWQLLVLSAKTNSALDSMTTNLVEHLKRNPDLNLADVAYTLQVGRRSFGHRRMLVCRDLSEAIATLDSRDSQGVTTLFRDQRDRPIVFLFSGQGAQYANMAKDLYQDEPAFREQVDRCAMLLRQHIGLDLRDVIFDDRPTTTDDRQPPTTEHGHPQSKIQDPKSKIDETQYAQPALFAIEYALAHLWMELGIQPQAMIGHSIGEYVAACLAGVLSLEDALALVAERGRLMQQLPGGAMLAVPLPEQDLRPLLGVHLSLAAINGPSRCVVAGPTDAVDELEYQLAAQGLDCRQLHTSHAFHSQMMDPILEAFVKQANTIRLKAPSIPYISNVTGTWITAEEAVDPGYWARHLRETVRFADGLHELLKDPDRILLEVGPGRTLSTFARQHPDRAVGQTVLASLRHPQDQQSDVAFFLEALGQSWLAGARVDWPKLYTHERRHLLPLPTYPFERQRYWVAPSPEGDLARARPDPFRKQADIADWFSIPSWKRSMRPAPTLGDQAGRAPDWLVFSDASGLGTQLVERLEQAGQCVVTAMAGEQFEKLGERVYALRPRQPDDYDALLQALREAGTVPQMIVHLWSVTPNDQAPPVEEHYDRSQELGFYSLIFLAQALGKQNVTEPVRIGIVSNNMQKVAGESVLRPEKATLLGPCKVIPQEYPNITCQSIDIILPHPGTTERADLLDQISAELTAKLADSVIAYRDYDRWVQTFEPVRLDEAIDGRSRLKERGVYLITGGLGGIGLVLAEYLAQTARARLVLIGRSAFPEREAWGQRLATYGDQDGVGRKIRKLQELEDLGAEILVVSADVASEADMRAAVARAYERFGALHGVIHAAGIAGGGMIQLKTPEMAAQVLAPKVKAIQVLETVLAGVALDFMALCSSTIGVIGGIGQVDYCAANAFLDAYAHYNTSRRGVFTVSINWDAWEEVGMAVDTAAAYGLPEIVQAGYYEEIAHPLLDKRIRKTPNQEIYLTEFDGANHWVLAEHQIMGIPTIPGTAYLEIARSAFENHAGSGPVEIREVFFLTPLMVGMDEQKEVETILERDGDVVAFRVLSRSVRVNDGEPAWQEHVRGKIRRLNAEPPERRDIEAIVAKCTAGEITIAEEDLKQRERFVYWGPRWMSFKKAYAGTGEGLAVLELPEAFSADLDEFGLHPALLDVATTFGIGFAAADDSYLPLSYGRLKVKGSLPGKIYSYLKYRDTVDSQKETISFDITIMDQHGHVLVEIEDFIMKRVNAASTRLRQAAEQNPLAAGSFAGNGVRRSYGAPGDGHRADTGILSREGVEAFKRILSANRLPQVVVSTKDLQGAIERANTLRQSRILETIDKAQQFKPTYARPDVPTPYVAPRNETEQRIADVWRRVFGIDQVGVHDNFFELGGDSVLAIQIIAQAGEAGLQITPAQLFERQTIADLAALIDGVPAARGEPQPEPAPSAPTRSRPFDQDLPVPHDRAEERAVATPADFPEAGLSQEELDRFLIRLRNRLNGEDIEDIYALSPIQRGILFHNLYAPDSEVYFEQFTWTLHESIDIPAFENAWKHVVERHQVLRTSFYWEDLDEPLQLVHRRMEMPLEWHDWRAQALAEQAKQLEAFLESDRRRGFDLAHAPLMRVIVIRLDVETYQVIWSYHHLLLDGWSAALVWGEFALCYAALGRGEQLHLKRPRPYRDYVAWLREQDLAQAEAFWRRTLEGFAAPTPLRVDRAPGSLPDAGNGYDLQHIRLSAAATNALQALAQQQHLTLNTLVQGAWALLLNRYSSEDDVVFGTTVAGRPPALTGVESMVGVFINTLPVRARVTPGAFLLAWLQELQSQQVSMRQYEHSPLWRVQGWSGVPRKLPLFETIVVFENYPGNPFGRMGDLRLFQRTNYPLTAVAEPGPELALRIAYECDRFDTDTIARMLRHLKTVLEGIAADPDRRLSDLPLLAADEQQELLRVRNTTQATYPQDACFHHLFEAQVERTPDAVAVVYDGPPTADPFGSAQDGRQPPTPSVPLRTGADRPTSAESSVLSPQSPALSASEGSVLSPEHLTYRELNRCANQLAHYLQTLGVRPGTPVGICMERSPEMVVGLLGILKAGGAFLAFDPAFPRERLAFMLQDAGASATDPAAGASQWPAPI